MWCVVVLRKECLLSKCHTPEYTHHHATHICEHVCVKVFACARACVRLCESCLFSRKGETGGMVTIGGWAAAYPPAGGGGGGGGGGGERGREGEGEEGRGVG